MVQAGGPPGRGRVALLACLALFAALVGQAGAQDWKQGRLGHLAPLIGTYDYAAVLQEPAVREGLAALVGDDLPHILANLQVAGPIDFIQGNLVLQGNAPHQGTEEEATVWIGLYDGRIRAGLLHAGRFTLYATDGEFAYLPRALQDFFRPRTLDPPSGPPPGVAWIGRTR